MTPDPAPQLDTVKQKRLRYSPPSALNSPLRGFFRLPPIEVIYCKRPRIFLSFTLFQSSSIPHLSQICSLSVHCPKIKAEFRVMERSVDGMNLHREKYSGDFIPYNLPELFQGCEKLEKYPGLELASSTKHSDGRCYPLRYAVIHLQNSELFCEKCLL